MVIGVTATLNFANSWLNPYYDAGLRAGGMTMIIVGSTCNTARPSCSKGTPSDFNVHDDYAQQHTLHVHHANRTVCQRPKILFWFGHIFLRIRTEISHRIFYDKIFQYHFKIYSHLAICLMFKCRASCEYQASCSYHHEWTCGLAVREFLIVNYQDGVSNYFLTCWSVCSILHGNG